jgi:hypothetical protein
MNEMLAFGFESWIVTFALVAQETGPPGLEFEQPARIVFAPLANVIFDGKYTLTFFA